MLSPALEDSTGRRTFDIDVTVPVPTGKQLHIALIGHVSFDDEESFFLGESATCFGQESAWYFSVADPDPLQGRVSELPGFETGWHAMQVDVQMGVGVPTVSEWGVVVMTLLLLAAGTLVYARCGPVRNAA